MDQSQFDEIVADARRHGFQVAAQTTLDGHPIVYKSEEVPNEEPIVREIYAVTEGFSPRSPTPDFEWVRSLEGNYHVPLLLREALRYFSSHSAQELPTGRLRR
jgi:hypothetical protein